jgi:hypothetical protein
LYLPIRGFDSLSMVFRSKSGDVILRQAFVRSNVTTKK